MLSETTLPEGGESITKWKGWTQAMPEIRKFPGDHFPSKRELSPGNRAPGRSSHDTVLPRRPDSAQISRYDSGQFNAGNQTGGAVLEHQCAAVQRCGSADDGQA
jgi:hypothetical protein